MIETDRISIIKINVNKLLEKNIKFNQNIKFIIEIIKSSLSEEIEIKLKVVISKISKEKNIIKYNIFNWNESTSRWENHKDVEYDFIDFNAIKKIEYVKNIEFMT